MGDCWVGRCCLPLLFSRLQGGMAGTLPPARQCRAVPAGPRPTAGTQAVWSTLCHPGLPTALLCCAMGYRLGGKKLFFWKKTSPLKHDKGQPGMKENGKQCHCATSAFTGPWQTLLLIHLNQAHSWNAEGFSGVCLSSSPCQKEFSPQWSLGPLFWPDGQENSLLAATAAPAALVAAPMATTAPALSPASLALEDWSPFRFVVCLSPCVSLCCTARREGEESCMLALRPMASSA